MRTPRIAYLMIFLLISAQVDNVWAVAPVLSAAPLVDEDDEYIPSERTQGEESSARQEPIFVGLKPRTAEFSFVSKRVPTEWNSTTPFATPPLHVFKSLQI